MKAPLPVYWVPMLSLKPRRISHYMAPHRRITKRSNPFKTGKEAYDTITGLSYKARQRIHTYTQYLVDSSTKKRVYSKSQNKWFSFKVNFITLTLPSRQTSRNADGSFNYQNTDQEIHQKVFKEFIAAWKRKEPNLMYIYKAEVQDNQNLHYHLTTNSYIHHTQLRNMWNHYVNKLGYVDRSKVSDPNSTDVHSVIAIEHLAEYIGKYMSKSDHYSKPLQRYHRMFDKYHKRSKETTCRLPKNYLWQLKRKVQMKLWDCSLLLKKVEPIRIENPTKKMEAECRAIHEKYKTTKKFEYCWIQGSNKKILQELAPTLFKMYDQSLYALREANKLVKSVHEVE